MVIQLRRRETKGGRSKILPRPTGTLRRGEKVESGPEEE
jgi:hypothetical protein